MLAGSCCGGLGTKLSLVPSLLLYPKTPARGQLPVACLCCSRVGCSPSFWSSLSCQSQLQCHRHLNPLATSARSAAVAHLSELLGLGTPIGAPEFVAACARERLEQERGLLAELPQLPDLQCAWLLLLFCATPRAQHLLRTVSPSQSAAYAEAHDRAVWDTLQALLGERGAAWPEARRLAFLPA